MHNLLVKPIITEKSMALTASGKFTFAVTNHATKYQIKELVQQLYQVKVLSIQTISMTGKVKRALKTRHASKQSDWKKAVVKLAKGQTIDLFDLPTEDKKTKPAKKASK